MNIESITPELVTNIGQNLERPVNLHTHHEGHNHWQDARDIADKLGVSFPEDLWRYFEKQMATETDKASLPVFFKRLVTPLFRLITAQATDQHVPADQIYQTIAQSSLNKLAQGQYGHVDFDFSPDALTREGNLSDDSVSNEITRFQKQLSQILEKSDQTPEPQDLREITTLTQMLRTYSQFLATSNRDQLTRRQYLTSFNKAISQDDRFVHYSKCNFWQNQSKTSIRLGIAIRREQMEGNQLTNQNWQNGQPSSLALEYVKLYHEGLYDFIDLAGAEIEKDPKGERDVDSFSWFFRLCTDNQVPICAHVAEISLQPTEIPLRQKRIRGNKNTFWAFRLGARRLIHSVASLSRHSELSEIIQAEAIRRQQITGTAIISCPESNLWTGAITQRSHHPIISLYRHPDKKIVGYGGEIHSYIDLQPPVADDDPAVFYPQDEIRPQVRQLVQFALQVMPHATIDAIKKFTNSLNEKSWKVIHNISSRPQKPTKNYRPKVRSIKSYQLNDRMINILWQDRVEASKKPYRRTM